MRETEVQTRATGAGRPRQMSDTARRAHLVQAAGALFLNKGYHATTMDDVARSASMSKKTVYQVFAAKSELFDALLSDWLSPFAIPFSSEGGSLTDVLTDLLTRLVSASLAETQVAMLRLLIAETSLSEDIAEALERQGIGKGKGALEQWMAEQASLGLLKIDDPVAAANMLFFAAAGDFLFSRLLRTRQPPSAADIAGRVRQAVTQFLLQAA